MLSKNIAASIMLVAMFILFQPLRSMDDPQSDKSSRILSLIIYNKPVYFHHKDICSLALVNKESQKAIKDTALNRRNHLEALDPKGSSLALCNSPLTWHKYGSMCAARAITFYSHDYGVLELRLFTYNHHVVNVMCSKGFEYRSQRVGEYQSFFNRVRIDHDGGVFSYGFSNYNDQELWGKDYHVLEYSCSKLQKSYVRRCAITIKDSTKNYALSYLIPLPALFKALLQAPIAQQDNECKFYDLSCAMIPDNYQQVGKDYLYLHTFDKDLPEELKKAIVKRYEEQKRK